MNIQDFLNKITQTFNKEVEQTNAVESKSFDIYLFIDTVLEILPNGMIVDLYVVLKHVARLCSDTFSNYTLLTEMVSICAEIIYDKYTPGGNDAGDIQIYESATFLELVNDEEPINDSEDYLYNCLTQDEYGMFIVKQKVGAFEQDEESDFNFF